MTHNNQHLTLTTISGKLAFDNSFIDKMNQIKQDFESLQYKKGQILFNEGNLPRGLFYVESGIIKIYKYGIDGKEQIIKLLKNGDLLGYKSLLTNAKFNISASILEDAVITFIPKEDFLDLFRADAEFADKVTQLLCNDLEEMESKMVSMAYKPVRGRLAETLLKLDDVFSQSVDKNKQNKIKLSREDLANIIGTAKETVIRLLSEFKSENLIKTEGKIINIIDPQGLVRIDNLYH